MIFPIFPSLRFYNLIKSDLPYAYQYIAGVFLWLSGKEFTCNSGDAGDMGSIPGSGISPGERNGNPLWCYCLENLMDRGSWQATVHVVTESGTTQ